MSKCGCRIRSEGVKFWIYLVHTGLLLLKINDHSSIFSVWQYMKFSTKKKKLEKQAKNIAFYKEIFHFTDVYSSKLTEACCVFLKRISRLLVPHNHT